MCGFKKFYFINNLLIKYLLGPYLYIDTRECNPADPQSRKCGIPHKISGITNAGLHLRDPQDLQDFIFSSLNSHNNVYGTKSVGFRSIIMLFVPLFHDL